jgi:Flp pilus assembly protein TadG
MPKQRSNAAQSLIETMAGIVIIIPLGLFSYDLTYIIVANQNNELIADTAARAAANHGDNSSAQLAAQQAIDDFQKSANYGKTSISDFQYNVDGSGQVIVCTQLNANLPVALANWTAVTISAKGVQPIVGVPIPR